MSEEKNAQVDAIDEIFRNNPDMPTEHRTKLNKMRESALNRETERLKTWEAAAERQRKLRITAEERREKTARQSEERKAFYDSWQFEVKKQTELLRRISEKI